MCIGLRNENVTECTRYNFAIPCCSFYQNLIVRSNSSVGTNQPVAIYWGHAIKNYTNAFIAHGMVVRISTKQSQIKPRALNVPPLY